MRTRPLQNFATQDLAGTETSKLRIESGDQEFESAAVPPGDLCREESSVQGQRGDHEVSRIIPAFGGRDQATPEGFRAQPRAGFAGAGQPGALSFQYPVNDGSPSGGFDRDLELHGAFLAESPESPLHFPERGSIERGAVTFPVCRTSKVRAGDGQRELANKAFVGCEEASENGILGDQGKVDQVCVAPERLERAGEERLGIRRFGHQRFTVLRQQGAQRAGLPPETLFPPEDEGPDQHRTTGVAKDDDSQLMLRGGENFPVQATPIVFRRAPRRGALPGQVPPFRLQGLQGGGMGQYIAIHERRSRSEGVGGLAVHGAAGGGVLPVIVIGRR